MMSSIGTSDETVVAPRRRLVARVPFLVTTAMVIVLAVSLTAQLAPMGSVTAATRCFDADNPLSRRTMRGNLDGDGQHDRVWVGARRRDGRCRYFVVARSTCVRGG